MALRAGSRSSSTKNGPAHTLTRDPCSDESLAALMAIPSPTQPSSEDRSGEEEVFTHLDEEALIQLPKHLQKNMREMQAERLQRLLKTNPQLEVRESEFWRKQDANISQNVPARESSKFPVSTSLQPRAKDHPNPQSAFTNNLEDNINNRINGYAFAQQNLFTEKRQSIDTKENQTQRSWKVQISSPVPGSFRHLSHDHLSVPWEVDKEKATFGGQIVRSQSSKSITCSMRARVKKSIHRLNKLIRNQA